MRFELQAGNPMLQECIPDQAEDLAQAIQSIFRTDTEDAFLVWNWVPVRINYRYDLSVLIDDLLPLLSELIDHDEGSHDVYWGSDTFRAQWDLRWGGGRMTIVARWESVAGGYEDLLNSRDTLEFDRGGFLTEWKALLANVIHALDRAQIHIADQTNVAALRKLEMALPSFGARYRRAS